MKRLVDKSRLPDPLEYFDRIGLKLIGRGEWRSASCPLHEDRSPSLRVNVRAGAFRCLSCGIHGGDLIAFHQARYGLPFIEAARRLGALED